MHPVEPIADTNFCMTDLLSKEGKEPLHPLRSNVHITGSITSDASPIADDIEIVEQPRDPSIANADPMNDSQSPVSEIINDAIGELPNPLSQINGHVIPSSRHFSSAHLDQQRFDDPFSLQ
jgi:hypothetical protein